MSDILELCLASISSGALYFLSNYHTYNIGVATPCLLPLQDFFHDILPDWSTCVHWRDYILPIFFLPLLFIDNRSNIIYHLIQGFMYIITLKAITIFFTFIPPSNPKCAEKKQVNHCFHQIFSGHNSLIVLICVLYMFQTKSALCKLGLIMVMIMYSLFILMTRAHYTVDIIVSYIIVLLLFQDLQGAIFV